MRVLAQSSSQPALSVTPSKATLQTGQRLLVESRYRVANPEKGLEWKASSGTLLPEMTGASAFYVAGKQPGGDTVTVKSKADDNLSADCIISVLAKDNKLSIAPSEVTLTTDQNLLMEAVDPTGTILEHVQWSIQEANGGQITAAGQYFAPSEPGTYHVKAVSGPQSAEAVVHVLAVSGGDEGGGTNGDELEPTNDGITILPQKVEILAGTSYPLEAVVAGGERQTVEWKVEQAPTDASIDAKGVFQSSRPGTYRVQASTNTNPRQTGTAIITVKSTLQSLTVVSPNSPDLKNIIDSSIVELKDGRILVAGGYDKSSEQFSARSWIYDPSTNETKESGTMAIPRRNALAACLADGRVLLVGGAGVTGKTTSGEPKDGVLLRAELYNPQSGTFVGLPESGPGSLFHPHFTGQLVALENGNAALMGGRRSSGLGISDGDYIPLSHGFNAATGLFTAMPKDLNPEQVRLVSFGAGNAATHFEKDRILVTGGYRRSYMDPDSKFEFGADGRAVWFDPIGCVGTLASPMTTKRQSHTATRLADGRVLVVGGATEFTGLAPDGTQTQIPDVGRWKDTPTAELFDPKTNTFKPTGSLKYARQEHAAVLLPTGKVLIVGGYNYEKRAFCNAIELYDPETGKFEVMEYLDYGIQNPKVILQKDGKVFISGIVQAPMVPTAMLDSSNSQGLRMMAPSSRSDATLTAGSGLTKVMSTGGWAIVDPFVNQGVEIAGVTNGTTFAPLGGEAWKNVPLIVDRPALTKLTLWCGTTWNKEIPVKIEIQGDSSFNPIYTVAKPEKRGLLVGYKHSNNFLLDAFVIPQSRVKANLTLKLTVQPPGCNSEELRLTIPFQAAPPINVDLVPVDYIYNDAAGARRQYALSAAELNTFRNDIESALMELYPASLGQINVNVQSFRASWSEDGKDMNGVNLWQIDPNNPTIPFSGLLDASSSGRTTRWTNLETYFFQQMTVKPRSTANDRTWYSWAFPKNRYVIGVVPMVAGTTVPTTPGTTYTAGGALTGECHFVVALNQSALDAVHEVGHAHGCQHSPYGGVANIDPNWPTDPAYSGAAIGVPGWSVITQTQTPDKPTTKKDIMCYPDAPSWYWISNYNFYNIFQWEKQSETLGDH